MTAPNRPGPGEMLLDHTGHFIADAGAGRLALEALGFTVTPYSAQVQPDPETGEPVLTGTGNVCAMLPEGYLEFLVHTADTPIGLEFQAALERRAGLHLAAFAVPDAAARHAEAERAGHPMRPLVHFSREVETAIGHATAAFSVARLKAGTMPEGRVQVMTHHNVDAMWQNRWTAHRNGARQLKSIVISAPSVGETAARFEHFLGVRPEPSGAGLRLELDRGAVEILPESAARALTGVEVEPGRSVFAALRIGLDDPADFRATFAPARARETDDGALAVPFHPALGRGAWLFEAA